MEEGDFYAFQSIIHSYAQRPSDKHTFKFPRYVNVYIFPLFFAVYGDRDRIHSYYNLKYFVLLFLRLHGAIATTYEK